MYIDSSSIRSFYSCHSRFLFENKSTEYLVINYQRATALLDVLNGAIPETEVIYVPKFNCSDKCAAFKSTLSGLKSEYFSTLSNRLLGVILNQSKKLQISSITESDLFSYGEEVLLYCVRHWDKNVKVKFITYFTNAVMNMMCTLKNKKHFRDWNKNVTSLDDMVEVEDYVFELPDKNEKPLLDALISSYENNTKTRKKPVRYKNLNGVLNNILFNKDYSEQIKTKLGIKDDLYLHYLILRAKKKKSLINDNEKMVMKFLKETIKEARKKSEISSKIYMHEPDTFCEQEETGEYKTNQKHNIKEELLCQE